MLPPQDPVFRAVLDSVFAGRAYRWADEPRPLGLLRRWWHQLGDWLRGLQADNPVVYRLLVLGLFLVLVLVLAHALWMVWRTVRAGVSSPGVMPSRPVEPRDADWYARAADRAAADGRLLEALQLAFMALALGLDGQGLLRYHGSKTPAECVRDARLAPADRERLRAMVSELYLHVFGGRPVALDDYRRWRAAGAGPWHAPAG